MRIKDERNIAKLGDVIKMSITYDLKDIERLTVRLVDYNTRKSGEVQEVSIFSVIGKAIYNKELGKGILTNINDRKVCIIMDEKVEEKDDNYPKIYKR